MSQLSDKIRLSLQAIQEWHEHFHGATCVSFSGGKDSSVLLHLVRSLYPETPALFANTGVEFPEILSLISTTPNVRWLTPDYTFAQVIERWGYPVVDKRVAAMLSCLQQPTATNATTRNTFLTGRTSLGRETSRYSLPKKWYFLIDAPFKISSYCCAALKTNVLNLWTKIWGLHPFLGVRAEESYFRRMNATTCNRYYLKHPVSKPLLFWTEQDILRYISKYDVPLCSVYGNIVNNAGVLSCTGERSTGCIYCLFGIHLETKPNRLQRLKLRYPDLYQHGISCLGLGQVLDYMKLPY